jgi:dTDP-4-amino-4,6-dideoxygalactose transaminase
MNSRLDEIQAAVLRIGLPKLDSMNQLRGRIVEQYSKALEGSNIRLITAFDPGNVAHLAVLQLPKKINRNDFQNYMKGLGISTDIHYPILDCDQKGLAAPRIDSQLLNSRSASDSILTIPLFPELRESEVTRIVTALASFC